ncbi:MAG TPA: IS4 family transposase [Anaerolineae bacterium]
MNQGQTVFAQIAAFLSHNEFNRCVARYEGNRHVRRLSCWEQFLAMAFAQLTYRESLRDIEVCLGVQHRKLYHSGFRNPVKRSTLAEANEARDWQIYADFAHSLIAIARPLYADEDLGLDLDATVYALDATTIDLCLALFPWAHFRRAKGAVKLHTMIDLRGAIPVFIDVTDGKVHDVNVLDVLVPEPGAYLIMDRGYLDFARLYQLQQALSFFVIRAKCNLQFRRRYSHPIDPATGVRSDQTIVLTGPKTAMLYPMPLRRVSYYAADLNKRFVFLTNNFTVSAPTVAALYHCRWQIELFFKWIKQHLRIKSFFGTSANSVKTQIWIAIAVYVLVAIIKKQLRLPHRLYTILQILSLTLFEKIPISSLFSHLDPATELPPPSNQLTLFDF